MYNRVVLTALLTWVAGAAAADSISKCQDADGNWYYGDYASEKCAESKVTRMNRSGVTVDEEPAPLSEDELAAQRTAEAQAAEAKQLAEAREQRRRQIMAVYDSEDDIRYVRDKRLAALEQRTQTEAAILTGLEQRAQRLEEQINGAADEGRKQRLLERHASIDEQIQKYRHAIADSETRRQEVLDEYEQELKTYRELTDASP